MITKLNSFIRKCVRVWHVLKKPSSDEFKVTAKVSALGILIIGFLGFLVAIIMSIFK